MVACFQTVDQNNGAHPLDTEAQTPVLQDHHLK